MASGDAELVAGEPGVGSVLPGRLGACRRSTRTGPDLRAPRRPFARLRAPRRQRTDPGTRRRPLTLRPAGWLLRRPAAPAAALPAGRAELPRPGDPRHHFLLFAVRHRLDRLRRPGELE